MYSYLRGEEVEWFLFQLTEYSHSLNCIKTTFAFNFVNVLQFSNIPDWSPEKSLHMDDIDNYIYFYVIYDDIVNHYIFIWIIGC